MTTGATTTQFLLLLDVSSQNPLDIAEVENLLPPERRNLFILSLTEFGAERCPPTETPNWALCSAALARMLHRVREQTSQVRESSSPAGGPVRYYVAGRAPLPLFFELGLELSKWGATTLLNQRPDKKWDELDLDASRAPGVGAYFTKRSGLDLAEPSEASGRLAVFISTHYALDKALIRKFCDQQGVQLAGIVAAYAERKLLGSEFALTVAEELQEILERARERYPNSKGLIVFAAGPTTLAFLAGRAVNPNIIENIWVPNFEAGEYRLALELPRRGHVSSIREGPEADLERIQILNRVRNAIGELQRTLRPEHFPRLLKPERRAALTEHLTNLETAVEPEGEAFRLSVGERSLSIGRGLLEGLTCLADEQLVECVGQCFLVHEMYHREQGLQSTTYHNIGRAGIALEDVDYWADAVAIATLTAWQCERQGRGASVREICSSYVSSTLSGIEAFDRFSGGDRIEVLYERRLRRYLIWHLQYARAKTLPDDIDLGDLWDMLGKRLVVELAPLRGRLDARFQKIVVGPLESTRRQQPLSGATEFFAVLEGRLFRHGRKAGFDPGALVDCVREFRRQEIESQMDHVRDENRALTPWVA